jgi:transglutaminase-like putative cysteine protease
VTLRRSLSLLAVSVFTWLSSAGPAKADEWQPISPEELKMISMPEAPGAPAVYLYRQVDRNDSNRASSEYNYIRVKILTEEGRKYANVEIPFEKKVHVSNIRARTIRPDGSIANFDGKVYENTIVKSKTLKVLAKTFTVPDVQIGSIIEYHYNYDFEDNFIFNSYWSVSDELFTKRAQFTLKPYTREQWTVQWSWPAGLPQGTEPPKEGQDGIIRMSSSNIPAFQIEDYMPPENELKSRVIFTYYEESPEPDVDKFWKKFGKKYNDYVESFINKRKAMEQAVAEIVSPGDAPEVKLQKIYSRTQQIRNLSYETARSEQENKREKIKEIKNVEDLWKNGYGNGRDITWLFLALARAAGFEAHPCLVSARNNYFFNKVRKNGRELNSNVVVVKLNGKDQYFDPGAAFTPFGMLEWTETATTGLKLDKDGGTWIQTSVPASSESRIERTAALKLTDEGALEGKLKLSFSGLEGMWRRVEERNEDDTERKKFLEEQVKEYIPVGIEVELTNKPDWKNSQVPLVAEFDLKVPGWVSSAGRRALFPAELFSATEKHMFEHANRNWPVYFNFPFKKLDDVVVGLPAGWQVGSLPKPADSDAKAAEYTMKIENNNGSLHIQRELRCDLMLVPKETYPVLRRFFEVVRTLDEQQIVLQPGGAAARN